MKVEPIIRSICLFAEEPTDAAFCRLEDLYDAFCANGFEVQTRRLLARDGFGQFKYRAGDAETYTSMGALDLADYDTHAQLFQSVANLSCSIDITEEHPTPSHVAVLLDLIRVHPHKTFYFSYSINQPPSSPFFPSARYGRPGFSVGLQATDLAASAATPGEWCQRMREAWHAIAVVADGHPDFIGIDASIAPLGAETGSLVGIARRFYGSFNRALTTDFFVGLTNFLKTENPRPCGLNGLMFPCLEDTLLAEEYEAGRFDIVRSLFVSLNSGVGIDTYPIGIDEDPEAILEVLNLTRQLSLKYNKPLGIRFVSDGRTAIGSRSTFDNPYLSNVLIRKLTAE